MQRNATRHEFRDSEELQELLTIPTGCGLQVSQIIFAKQNRGQACLKTNFVCISYTGRIR